MALVALVAVLLVPRGDKGGLSQSEYEQKVRIEYARVQLAFRNTNVQSQKLLAARVADAQRELRRAADELDDAKPPGDVTVENDQLVAGMRQYADDLEDLRQAAARGDAAAVARFNQSVGQNQGVRQMAEAAEEMKFEGYDLGPIAEE